MPKMSLSVIRKDLDDLGAIQELDLDPTRVNAPEASAPKTPLKEVARMDATTAAILARLGHSSES